MTVKISRAFRDISLSFSKNPITNDIIVLHNEDAIKKSVMNLVRTKIGERYFNNLLGSNIVGSLFELNISDNLSYYESEIKVLLENFEPRIRTKEVLVDNDPDSNDMNVRISYDIIGLPFPQQNIEFILVPARV
jgi:phage baseplate assembly protein W